MAIEDSFFNVQISLAQARAASDNSQIAMQLTHSVSWVERVRQYTDLDAHEVDFPVGTVEHLQAKAFFDNDPNPGLLKVGRCENKPTMRWALTPLPVDDDTYAVALVEPDGTRNPVSYVAGTMVDLPYTAQTSNFTVGKTLTGGTSGAKAIIFADTDAGATGTLRLVGLRGTFVNGETITDDGGVPGSATAGTPAAVTGVAATVSEIVNGLRSLLDGLGKAITFSDQTTFLRGTADVAGAWYALEVSDPAKLGVAMDHADPGYEADLSAIQTEDSAWGAVFGQFPSAAVVAAISGWVESRSKIFYSVTQDSEVETQVLTGATHIAATLRSLTRNNTFLLYRRRPSEFTDAGLVGGIYALLAGSETHAFKTVPGSTPDALTDFQFANVQATNANAYIVFSQANRVIEGKVSSGKYADLVRFQFWQVADVEISVANATADAPGKLPMDDEGIAVIQSEVLASLKRGVARKGLRSDPPPVVNAPAIEDVPAADRAARNLTGITAVAFFAGAIHKVNPLRITLTV